VQPGPIVDCWTFCTRDSNPPSSHGGIGLRRLGSQCFIDERARAARGPRAQGKGVLRNGALLDLREGATRERER